MFDNSVRSPNGNFPNIIYKKKLTPLPLFKQNQIQKVPLTLESPAKTSPFGFGINSRSAGVLPNTVKASPSKTFLSEFKTVNNYGRLCDQPFLEFTSFHYEQVFGSGGGKKKIKLDPIQQKKDKKKIQKMYTIGLPNNSTLQSSAIKVEDNSTTAAANGHSAFFRDHKDHKDHKEHEVESPKTAKTVQKAYRIGEYEALISFVSIQISLVPANKPNKAPLVMLMKRDDLKKIYKKPPAELCETILECLQASNNRISLRIGKENAQSSRYVGDETFPEKKSGLSVTLDGQEYNVTIHFPRMEICIDALDYQEKIMMKPMYLTNLFEENFDNLQDYVARFSLPDATYKGKEEIRNEKLKALPTIIKKVVNSDEFGGTMLFKSMEIHLKNTSDFEPQIMMHESSLTPMQRNMNNRKKKDVNNVVLRVPIDELEKILKADVEELVELMKESIIVEEGKGFSLAFDAENTKPIQHRDEYRLENFPQGSEKFNVRFNRFLYELHIKFPTLELYVPETNFKDVVQLSPSQLQDLINNTFENMQDYLECFRKPTSSQRDREPTESAEERTPVQSERETRNPIISITEAKDEEPIEEEEAQNNNSPGSEDAIAESHEVVLTPKAAVDVVVEKDAAENNTEETVENKEENAEVVAAVETENQEAENKEEVVVAEEAAVVENKEENAEVIATVETENQEENKEENAEVVATVETENQEEKNDVEAPAAAEEAVAEAENKEEEENVNAENPAEVAVGENQEGENKEEAPVVEENAAVEKKQEESPEEVAAEVAQEEANVEIPSEPVAEIQADNAAREEVEMSEGSQKDGAQEEVNNSEVEKDQAEKVEEVEMVEGAQEENNADEEPKVQVEKAEAEKVEEIEAAEGAQEENNGEVEKAEAEKVEEIEAVEGAQEEKNAEVSNEAQVEVQEPKAEEPEEVEAVEGSQEEVAQEENKQEEVNAETAENVENVEINNDEKVEQAEVEGDVVEGQEGQEGQEGGEN